MSFYKIVNTLALISVLLLSNKAQAGITTGPAAAVDGNNVTDSFINKASGYAIIPAIQAGIIPDGFTAQDGVCTADSTTFSSNSGNFSSSSVGKELIAAGCGQAPTETVTIGGTITNIEGITNAATTSSNDTLSFASVPSGATTGQYVFDITTPGVIPYGTTATVSGSSVTLSNNTTGTVNSGDTIEFADAVSLTFTSSSVSGSPLTLTYITQPNDTTSQIALRLEQLIDIYNVGQPLETAGINASVASNVITIANWNNLSISYSDTISGAATETVAFSTGTTPAPLKTTIASYISPTEVTTVTEALTSQTDTQWSYGTDYSSALAAYITDNPGVGIYFPPGQIILDSASIVLNEISLHCNQSPANDEQTTNQYAPVGTTFVIVNQTQSPFLYKDAVAINNCNYFYPGEYNTSVTPYPYPALFANDGASPSNDITIKDNTVINAYDFFDQLSNSTGNGRTMFVNDNINALRYAFSFDKIGESDNVTGTRDDVGPYFSIMIAGNYNLANWKALNGTMFHFYGNGTPTAASTTFIDGIYVSGTFGYELGIGLLCDSCVVNESHFSDGALAALEDVVSNNGVLYNTPFSNWGWISDYYYNGAVNLADASPTIYIRNAPPLSNSAKFDLQSNGGALQQTQGNFIDVNSANIAEIKFFGIKGGIYNDNNLSSVSYYANITAPSALIEFEGDTIYPAGGTYGATSQGILINGSVGQLIVNGNSFSHEYCALTFPTSGQVTVTGNTATNTSSTYSLCGTYKSTFQIGDNSWDLPNPSFDIGSYISSDVTSGVSLFAGGTPVNVTSISLPPGDWDVRGTCQFVENTTTTTTVQECAINTTSATNPTQSDTSAIALNEQTQPANISNYWPVAVSRLLLTTTTTVYLIATAKFATSTESATGWISARRVH